MNDHSPSPLYLGESPAAVPIPRAVVRAYLYLVAGLGGATTAGLLVFAVATDSSASAERIARSGSYGQTLVAALAVSQSRRAP